MRWNKRAERAIKVVMEPRIFIPTIIGVGLLVALVLAANPREALRLIARFHPLWLVAFFLLMAGYEVVRCAQWGYMLRQLGLPVPRRTMIFGYAIGEFTKNVPLGNFVPDVVLARARGADFGRASSSSLLVSVLEVAVALAGIVIIGIDGWSWVRPLILIGGFAFMLLAWAFYRWYSHVYAGSPGSDGAQTDDGGHEGRFAHAAQAPGWARRALGWRWVQRALEELRQFLQGEATLLHPHVIAVCALACSAYMLFSGLALYAVIRGLGFAAITWDEALVASFFSLAVSTIIPVPTDLGTSEASGAGALVALGMTTTGAISALLLYRFLNLVEQVLVALLASLALPEQFRALWHTHSRADAPPPA